MDAEWGHDDVTTEMGSHHVKILSDKSYQRSSTPCTLPACVRINRHNYCQTSILNQGCEC